MDIAIISIGKFRHEDPNKKITTQYFQRIRWKISLIEIDHGKIAPSKEAQSLALLSKIDKNRIIIAMDERGKEFSSPAFAKKISTYANNAQTNLAFLIGGSEGHSKLIYEKADLLLSFGKMTWPHMMVRSLLAEQIYRAYTIITGHPYHKA